MDWSTTEDDDGLDGPSGVQTRESTVVVDPISQIPEPIPSFRREPVEKTEVLTGRRIDQLRAEVHRKRKEQRRQQHRRIALWGFAGAGAVLFGALLAGLVFSGSSQAEDARSTRGPFPPAAIEAETTRLPERTAEAAPPRAEVQKETSKRSPKEPSREVASGSLSLDDLPAE